MTSTQLRPAALAAPLLEALETAAWVVLVGPLPFGLEEALLEAAAASGRPVLLIDSRLEPEAELSQRLAQDAPPRLTFCSELLAAEAGEQGWYRYNDSRLNGTAGPDALLPQRPNLRLEGLELRPARRLDAVLLAWLEQAAADGRAEGLLWLPVSLAPDVLAGAGVFLERLGAIWLAGAAANGCADDVADQLETSCYRLVSDGSDHQVWQLDRQSLLERQLRLLGQQREVLQTTVEELQGQLNAQSAQTVEQSQQREALGVRCEELQALLSSQQAANAQLQSDREVLAKERDEWRGKAEAQEGRLQTINQELDEILALLDAGTTDSPAADVEPISQTD